MALAITDSNFEELLASGKPVVVRSEERRVGTECTG